jgi:hypothetical protein
MLAVSDHGRRAAPAAVVVAIVLSILYGGLTLLCALALAALGLLLRTATSNAADAGPKTLAEGLASVADVGAAASAALVLWAVASLVAAGFAWRGASWSRGALIASFGLAATLKVYLAWEVGHGWSVALASFALLDAGVVAGVLRARAHFGPRA